MAQYTVVGPGLFVTVVGAGLVLLGILLLVQIARGERFEPQEAEDADAHRSADWRALGTTVLAAVVPLATIRRLGFAVTASLMFALVARALGSRRLVIDLVLGLVIGTLAWLLFSRLLGVELPGFLPAFR
jgi:putative tricarboxylic transport membrane protein